MRIFNTCSPTEIPPVAKTGFSAQNNLSERFFATVKTTSGETSKTTVLYDHYRSKWLFGASGVVEVVEYYKEIPAQQFIQWIAGNPHIGHLDVATLAAMFHSMDEEDK